MTTENKTMIYVPAGHAEPIELTVRKARLLLCHNVRTKSGKEPTNEDVIRIMLLCQAKALDPRQGDLHVTGYDTEAGPRFELIPSVYTFWTRASLHPEFDGVVSGIQVMRENPDTGQKFVEEREGSILLPGEELIGGFATCFRRDRGHHFTSRLPLSVYSTGRSRWTVDPAGMIKKCAESEALRKTFPAELGGLYTQEEMGTEA